jgi:hypothetical protein
MTVFDYKLDDSFDLVFGADGDFVEAESTVQHQQLLLLTEKGEWDGNPTVGVGADTYINSEHPQELVLEVRRQFEKDGMRVDSQFSYLDFEKFNIPAQY